MTITQAIIFISMTTLFTHFLGRMCAPPFRVGDCVRPIGYTWGGKITTIKGTTIEYTADELFYVEETEDLIKIKCGEGK